MTDRDKHRKASNKFFLHILTCRDELMWYRDKVGAYVPLELSNYGLNKTLRDAEVSGHFWSREDSGIRNIVKTYDVEVVNEESTPITAQLTGQKIPALAPVGHRLPVPATAPNTTMQTIQKEKARTLTDVNDELDRLQQALDRTRLNLASLLS